MKKIIAMTVLMILATFTIASAEPVTLKFSIVEPPQAFAVKNIWTPWVEKLNKEGEGLFKIDLYPGTLHRDMNQNLKVVLDGIADMTYTLPSYHGGVFPDDSVFELPFIGTNATVGSKAAYALWEKGLLRGYDNFIPLMVATSRQYTLHSTMPVKTPADLDGKKMRASGKMQIEMAKSFGAAPVGMPVTQIAEAMTRGIIQATTNEWNAMRTFKIQEVANYHCEVPLGTLSFVVIMNKDVFNNLPPKAQQIFLDNREYIGNLWATQMDTDLEKYKEKMAADPKQHFYTPTEEEMAQWKKATDEAIQVWLSEDPERRKMLKDAYEEEVEKIRGN